MQAFSYSHCLLKKFKVNAIDVALQKNLYRRAWNTACLPCGAWHFILEPQVCVFHGIKDGTEGRGEGLSTVGFLTISWATPIARLRSMSNRFLLRTLHIQSIPVRNLHCFPLNATRYNSQELFHKDTALYDQRFFLPQWLSVELLTGQLLKVYCFVFGSVSFAIPKTVHLPFRITWRGFSHRWERPLKREC